MTSGKGPSQHHYIPKFYLRQWVSDDNRFVRYDRPTPSKIMARRAFPSEAGWLKDLYTSPGDRLGAQWLEIDIFQVIDSRAAHALRKMNTQLSDDPLNAQERSAWTMFVRSLFHRTPENLRGFIELATRLYDESLESARKRYAELRRATDPETFDEYKASLTSEQIRTSILGTLPGLMASPRIGQFMQDMPTRVLILPSNARDFLISDDPIVRTNGWQNDDGHFALPISPRRLFLSAYRDQKLDEIAAMEPNDIVTAINTQIVEGARHFVAAKDTSQDRFIRNRFGRNLKAPILT